MLKALNSKKLIFLLFIALGFLGGLGVGRYFYSQRKSEEAPQPAESINEKSAERIYYIEDGETYPEWKKLKNKAVGYSIEYPTESNLVLNDNGEEAFIITTIGGIYIHLSSNSENIPLKDWVGKYRSEIKRKMIKEWEHTVNGKEAYSFTASGPAGEYQYTSIAAEQKILEIEVGKYLPVPETEIQKKDKENLFKMFDTLQILD